MEKNRARGTSPGASGVQTVAEAQQRVPSRPDQEAAAASGLETDWNAGPNYKEETVRGDPRKVTAKTDDMVDPVSHPEDSET